LYLSLALFLLNDILACGSKVCQNAHLLSK
jgi:hypothetical protein